MTVALGCVLGLGLVLTLSPLLWPRTGAGGGSLMTATGERMRARLALAGLGSLSPAVVAIVSLLIGVLVAAFVQATVHVMALSLLAGVLGLLSPAAMISWRAQARRRAHRTVWPDVVDHLVSAVRSGLSVPDSIGALARVGPESMRSAFGEFERDYRASGQFGPCLDRLKEALADPVADRILETLRMAREVGGSDLTTVLRTLASYLREEAAIRQEVEARQSWVRNAARLGVAAPWIVLALLASRPEAATAYNTPAGTAVIVTGLVVSILAYRVMVAIGHLPEERRWFG